MIHERIDPHLEEDIMHLSRLAHIKRYKKAAELIGSGKRVLDAGCGYGYGSKILAERSFRVIGIDVSLEAVDYARNIYSQSNTNFFRSDIVDFDCLEFGRFDVITLFEVLEHLTDPSAALKNIRNGLRRSGKLIISVPNGNNSPNNNGFHLEDYTPEDLEELLCSNGFEIEQRFGQYPMLGALAGAVGRVSGYQSNTNKGSSFIPRVIDRMPFLPEVFSGLYNSDMAVSTGRTIYFVAGLEK